MKRLNALDWVDGLCFSAFGVRIGLRVTISELLPQLLELLPPGWKVSKTRKVRWVFSLSSVPSRRKPGTLLHQLYTGGVLVTRGSNFERVRSSFAHELRITLALLSPWRVFVHAGAVGWKGRAIVLPGGSGSGKTTLTAALVRAGATFFSDEFAILDRKGLVHPYSLPLRMRKGEGPSSVRVAVEELGGIPGTKPLPVGLILATHYDPEGGVTLHRLSPGRAALALMAHANQARTRPRRVLETMGAAAQGAICLGGPRREAEEIVDRVLGFW